MTPVKINRNVLRSRAAAKGIYSIAELARQLDCSRQAVYFAIETPSRFKSLHQRINKLIGN